MISSQTFKVARGPQGNGDDWFFWFTIFAVALYIFYLTTK